MEFRILGSLEVVDDSGARVAVGGVRERALLVRLLLSPDQVVSSHQLIDDLWDDHPPDDPAHALRVHVSRLRKALREAGTDGLLVTRTPGYLLAVGAEAVDVARFEVHLSTARSQAARGDHSGASATLRAALALWRGPALADLADTPFFQAEAARLAEVRLMATEERIEADLACGRHAEIVAELDALTRAHPLRERLWGLRMLALYRAGRPADALRTYRELRTVLADELGLEPSPALEKLEGAILRHEPELDWSLLTPPTMPMTPTTDRPVRAAGPPPTAYARTDGVKVAYQVVGDGPLDIVLVPGFASNVDLYWSNPGWVEIFERLTRLGRLIVWDKRGTGLSDPVSRVPTLDERADDLLAVMDAVDSKRAVLFGISEGGPMALLFAAIHPDRVRSLVLYGVSPRFSEAPDWRYGFSSTEQAQLRRELEDDWGNGALIEIFAPTEADNDRARQDWGRIQRAGASPAMGLAVWDAMMATDCRDILSAVNVPTLVLHRRGDRCAHIEGARHIAAEVPGARLVEAPGENHLLPLGDRGPILAEIERFLGRPDVSPVSDRVLTTVVCIKHGSPANGSSADVGVRPLAGVEDFGGRAVATTNADFVAAFAAPSRAIAWAASVHESPSHIAAPRIGIHTGECEARGNELRGLAMRVAAAAAAMAEPGEVLVTRTVKDLLAGSDASFADRGTHRFPELTGEWSLFAVRASTALASSARPPE